MEEDKKPFKWIDKEEWDFHNKLLPSRYICGCDPIEENSPVVILPLQEVTGYRWDNLNKHAMENEKYYVPSLEEFRIGFEFELLQQGEIYGEVGYTNEYIETSIDDSMDFNNIWDLFNSKKETNVRVKYLDHEDLLSLGFKHIGGKMLKDVGQEYKWNNGRYWVHLNYTKLSDHCVLKIETSVGQSSIKTLVVHSIGIKNKSELIILMKQLNIN